MPRSSSRSRNRYAAKQTVTNSGVQVTFPKAVDRVLISVETAVQLTYRPDGTTPADPTALTASAAESGIRDLPVGVTHVLEATEGSGTWSFRTDVNSVAWVEGQISAGLSE